MAQKLDGKGTQIMDEQSTHKTLTKLRVNNNNI